MDGFMMFGLAFLVIGIFYGWPNFITINKHYYKDKKKKNTNGTT